MEILLEDLLSESKTVDHTDKDMWENTLLIAFADNGGDVTTGASNWPYRGTKTTPFEGGARARRREKCRTPQNKIALI